MLRLTLTALLATAVALELALAEAPALRGSTYTTTGNVTVSDSCLSGDYPDNPIRQPCFMYLGHGGTMDMYLHVHSQTGGTINYYINNTDLSSAPVDFIVYKDGNVLTQGGLHSQHMEYGTGLPVGDANNQWSLHVEQKDIFGHAQVEMTFWW